MRKPISDYNLHCTGANYTIKESKSVCLFLDDARHSLSSKHEQTVCSRWCSTAVLPEALCWNPGSEELLACGILQQYTAWICMLVLFYFFKRIHQGNRWNMMEPHTCKTVVKWAPGRLIHWLTLHVQAGFSGEFPMRNLACMELALRKEPDEVSGVSRHFSFSHFAHFTSQSFSAVHVALWPEALILCACTLYVVQKKGAKHKEPILIIVPWYHSCILVLCGCSPIFVSLWAYWTLPSWSRSSIRWWPRCLPLLFATWRRHQGLECQHVRSNHFWYSFMPLQSHLSKLASWEDCSSIFLFLLFLCRDDSIWYSLILSYVRWDMIKLTCKSQWSPYRSCRVGFSYLWDDHKIPQVKAQSEFDKWGSVCCSNHLKSVQFNAVRPQDTSHMDITYGQFILHGMYIYILLWYTYGIPHLYINLYI